MKTNFDLTSTQPHKLKLSAAANPEANNGATKSTNAAVPTTMFSSGADQVATLSEAKAATAAATGAPARAAAPAENERRTEVGNGVYTQNVSASRSFRLPRTVYLDRSSAFATVIPAMVSPATLAQMHRYTMQDPESAQIHGNP